MAGFYVIEWRKKLNVHQERFNILSFEKFFRQAFCFCCSTWEAIKYAVWTLFKAAVISNASLLSSVNNVTLTCCAAGQWSQIEVCLASAQNLTHNIMKTSMLLLLSPLQQVERKGLISFRLHARKWTDLMENDWTFFPPSVSVLLHACMSFLKCLQHALLFCMLVAQRWTVNNVWQHVWQQQCCELRGSDAWLHTEGPSHCHHIISGGKKKFCVRKQRQSL